MSGFLYFIPSIKQADSELIDGLGLSDRLPGGHVEQRSVSQGPDGNAGILLAYSGVVLYKPEDQTWSECKGQGHWLGYETANPPMPKDVLREDALAGHLCDLGDGNKWLIPVCRAIQTGAFFERGIEYALNESGKFEEQIRPDFLALSKDVEVLYSAFSEQYLDQEIEVEDADDFDQFDACERALALNYRLTKWEINALRLFTREALILIAQAMIDVPTVIEIGKKNAVL